MASADVEPELMTMVPARPHRRRRWMILRIVILLVVLGVGWFWLGQPCARKWQLAHACKAADRVVVVLNTPPKRTPDGHSTKGDRIACEVVGTDEVLDFLSIVSFKASIPGLTCACNGDVKLELANGRQTLATLTWHDGSHLRWHDGTWLGDTCLTQKSRQALSAWIDREGGEALEQARTKANAQWEEFRTTQEAEWKAEEAASTRTAQDDVKNE